MLKNQKQRPFLFDPYSKPLSGFTSSSGISGINNDFGIFLLIVLGL
jgi:hypothetical protein